MWNDWELSEMRKLQERACHYSTTRYVWCKGIRGTIAIAILLIAITQAHAIWHHFTAITGHVFLSKDLKKQWDFAYEYRIVLDAAAGRVCRVEKMIAKSTSEREALHWRSQQIVHEHYYAEIEAAYTIRMQEALQAGLVPPAHVLKKAPTLLMIKKQQCSPREAS